MAAILERGINVVSSVLLPALYPDARHVSPRSTRQLAQACERGESSLFISGIDPGFATDELPVMLTSICGRVDRIRMMEIMSYEHYDDADTQFRWFGFGAPIDSELPPYLAPGRLTRYWGPTVELVAAGIAVRSPAVCTARRDRAAIDRQGRMGRMDGNLLIRGGDLVDGTGAPARRADVRVHDGLITEVGTDLAPDGERVVDAGGAYVAPGLIESHTHFDAAVWWDPDCDPMPAHGCTTLVMANCGLGLAPLRAADRDTIVELFSFIEDIPAEAFRLAVPWTWETYGEYRAVAARHGTAVNTVGFLPHQLLRTWVMGDAAWDRPATAAEREQLCAVLDDALRAGALGLSTSVMDTDRDNRPVPSRQADDAEFAALVVCSPAAAPRCSTSRASASPSSSPTSSAWSR